MQLLYFQGLKKLYFKKFNFSSLVKILDFLVKHKNNEMEKK